ncbi:hypothetical protein RKD55_004632 [Rossellomorea marisflavi]
MGKPWTLSTQSISSMNYFFLRTVSGLDDYELINQELEGYIKVIAERYWMIDSYTRSTIIKEIKDGDYFKDEPLEEIEQSLNTVIARLAGDDFPSVAHFYTNLIEQAREQ